MKIILFFVFLFSFNLTVSQNTTTFFHNIALTFLEINPEARIGGIGEVDAVSSPFYNNTGLFRNPALLSKHQISAGIHVSYMPYLRKTVSDLNLFSLNGFYALNEKNAFGLNFTMFDQGDLIITDETGLYMGEDRVYDLYLQGTYNHSFNSSISTGIALKYIKSKESSLSVGNSVNTYALDLGFNYDDQYKLSETSYLNTSAGLAVSNLGPKISINNTEKFLPTKLLLGLFINPDLYINDKLRLNIELGYQAEKYLVPTPYSSIGDSLLYDSHSDLSSFSAIFESFNDAPGGFEEELHEIMHKFGSEFRLSHKNDFYASLRHGRIIEHETKGNRKYQTFGLGAGYKSFMLDFKIIGFSELDALNGTWSLSAGYQLNFGN